MAVLGRKVLGQRGKQDIPVLVIGVGRLLGEQRAACFRGLPAVFLQKFRHETPSP
jgi:hypothetical protein